MYVSEIDKIIISLQFNHALSNCTEMTLGVIMSKPVNVNPWKDEHNMVE